MPLQIYVISAGPQVEEYRKHFRFYSLCLACCSFGFKGRLVQWCFSIRQMPELADKRFDFGVSGRSHGGNASSVDESVPCWPEPALRHAVFRAGAAILFAT